MPSLKTYNPLKFLISKGSFKQTLVCALSFVQFCRKILLTKPNAPGMAVTKEIKTGEGYYKSALYPICDQLEPCAEALGDEEV